MDDWIELRSGSIVRGRSETDVLDMGDRMNFRKADSIGRSVFLGTSTVFCGLNFFTHSRRPTCGN